MNFNEEIEFINEDIWLRIDDDVARSLTKNQEVFIFSFDYPFHYIYVCFYIKYICFNGYISVHHHLLNANFKCWTTKLN